jgi:hypothetical protein
MIDLDEVQSRVKAVKVRTDMTLTGPAYEVVRDMPVLVAELRAAREVVQAAWRWRFSSKAYDLKIAQALGDALDTYDKIIRGNSP